MFTITSVELTEINLPLVHFFETSFGRTYERRIIFVRVEDADGAEGWGEVTCGETPSYSSEWTDSAWVTIEKILAPMVIGKGFNSATDVWDAFAKVRGHRMSKAAIETACWDLEAKKLGVPLWRHMGGHAPRSNAAFRSAYRTRSSSFLTRSRPSSTPVTDASRSRSVRVGTTTSSGRCVKNLAISG